MRALILAVLFSAALNASAQPLPDFKALMKAQGPAVVNVIAAGKTRKRADRSAAAGGEQEGTLGMALGELSAAERETLGVDYALYVALAGGAG